MNRVFVLIFFTLLAGLYYELNHDARLQYNLGYIYEQGKLLGFRFTKTQNHNAAVMWFKKAAGHDYARAQYALGIYYSHGWGVPKDESKAVFWFLKAARNDYPQSAFHLAWMYRKGEGGVSRDYVKAVTFFTEAASHCMAKAQIALADMYEKGQGMQADQAKALMWYSISEFCSSRYPLMFDNKTQLIEASELRTRLLKHMKKEQIKLADDSLNAWLNKYNAQ
jgi:TPR repeat protein